MRAGKLRERIRVERLIGGAWTVFAVLSASVLPGGTAAAAPALIPELPVAAPSVAYEVRIRYFREFPSDVRIRWGDRILAVTSEPVDPDGRRAELLLQCSTWLSYDDQHAQLLAAIAREGFAITFTKDSVDGYDSSTDSIADPSASTSTVAGFAKWIDDTKPRGYEPGTLVEGEAPKLVFVPTTYGQLPLSGALCTIGSEDFVIRDLTPIAPDGTAVGAYVTVER